MKKFLVLTLVLGMVPFAAAALQIGDSQGVILEDSQVYLKPDQTLLLTIVASDDQLANVGAVLGVLIADPILGSVTVGENAFNNVNPALGAEGIFDLDSETAGAFGMSTAIFADFIIPGSEYPVISGIVAGGIVFQCLGLGDVTIQLVDLEREGVVYDSLVIHQTPEPASMLLLGLGGLFLRRRK